MRSTILAIILSSTLLPAAAFAQSAPATPQPAPQTPAPTNTPSPELKEARGKMRTACADDVKKHCAGIERGKGALGRCLESHASELTPACTTARSELRALRTKKS